MAAQISRRRTVHADAAAVWDVLADFGAISAWAPGVDHSCVLTTGPDGPVGTTRRVQVGRMVLVERITEATPPRTFAYDIAGLPGPVRHAANRWVLEEAFGGATAVTLTSTVDMGPGRLRDIAATLFSRVMAKSSDQMLAGLAARWETT